LFIRRTSARTDPKAAAISCPVSTLTLATIRPGLAARLSTRHDVAGGGRGEEIDEEGQAARLDERRQPLTDG
jgi:hypothetical protein